MNSYGLDYHIYLKYWDTIILYLVEKLKKKKKSKNKQGQLTTDLGLHHSLLRPVANSVDPEQMPHSVASGLVYTVC